MIYNNYMGEGEGDTNLLSRQEKKHLKITRRIMYNFQTHKGIKNTHCNKENTINPN